MSTKDRAAEIYQQHIALASVKDSGFRKIVMDQIMEEMGCSLASAATKYNNAKKANPVEGLGRVPLPPGTRKASNKPKQEDDGLQPESQCFAVIELLKHGNDFVVGRCQTFLMQGDASETYDEKVAVWPASSWVMIQGLGPNHNETYKLDSDEKEIKRYDTKIVAVPKPRAVIVEDDDEDY